LETFAASALDWLGKPLRKNVFPFYLGKQRLQNLQGVNPAEEFAEYTLSFREGNPCPRIE